MRGSIAGLATPHPLGGLLPAIYQEQELSMRFTQAFDDVLSPLQLTLDCLDSYLDPDLTPSDVLQWLGGWLGLILDEDWPIERRRALVRSIVGLYEERGTAAGIARLVELYTGARVEIVEGGAAGFSQTPSQELPGTAADAFIVRVLTESPDTLDAHRIELLVASSRPAHLPAVVEIATA